MQWWFLCDFDPLMGNTPRKNWPEVTKRNGIQELQARDGHTYDQKDRADQAKHFQQAKVQSIISTPIM